MKKLLKSIRLARLWHWFSNRDNMWTAIVDDNVKKRTTIEFKNGSRIIVLPSQNGVRGNRAKEIHIWNNDEYEQMYKSEKIIL